MADYIKIDRKILEWEWYRNINTKVLFIHMLLKANWKDGRFEGKIVPRGSFVSSYPRLAEECDLTINELRTALRHLIETEEITVKVHSKYSVFTVNNYCQYQSINSQSTVNPQSINSLLTTIEERKKERRKEVKNTMCKADANALFESLWKLYPVKKGKGQISDTQKRKLLKIGFDEMSRAIDRYKRYVDSIDYLQYKNGSTFFNSGYVDYLDANYEQGKPKAKNKFGNFEQRDMSKSELAELEAELLKY